MIDPIIILVALGCGLLISLISFTGILTLSTNINQVRDIAQFLVALAAGGMIGGAIWHLLPETVEKFGGLTITATMVLLTGIICSYLLEAVLEWHHCHQIGGCEVPSHRHSIGIMNLYGDGVHNFIDGLVIAASFIASPILGFSVVLAVALHEIPQEFGDFGVLIQAGYSRRRALLYNFLSALTAMVGIIIVLILGETVVGFSVLLLPFAAGNFIYVSLTDLMPELHKERRTKRTFIQFIILLVGIGLMYALTLFKA
ncbi:MAG: ZIP family metal transporter [Promethearchaeota archaeon]